ncbi:MAG: DHCW motif cupin fold protein [Flavobacteriales bacterium]
MIIENIDPTTIDWETAAKEKLDGETGFAEVKTKIAGQIKIRQVTYSQGYLADHWCDKGHVLLVISGQLIIEHIDNTEVKLEANSAYVVGDNSMAHRAKSTEGALVLIVD